MTADLNATVGARVGPPEGSTAPGGCLLLQTLRRVACGTRDLRLLEAAFRDACGTGEGPTAWIAFRSFLVLIAIYGRRPITVAPPAWPMPTNDEHRLLQLFAAAQAGNADLIAAHLAWLLRPAQDANAAAMVCFVARALASTGHVIPLQTPARPARRAGSALRLVPA